MKCRTYKCKAACCYNIPFENGELEKYKDKIVNPVLTTLNLFGAVVPFTGKDLKSNRCPFLRQDLKCNIYENRPDICRKMGLVERMPCQHLKK
ncbi:MAG: YkgJ family cysteine cluster protein [Bacteroidales bacterium]|nr:YkgJ family cysteine cluster protein [Bacteroidales bacterium]MBO7617405.1 YkgJ family cysteine cluster protein [Bacteroidales bacterium]